MAETKKLVLVVESTVTLSRYWPTILSDYLQKLIKSFYGDGNSEPTTPTVEMALITFNNRGPYTSLQRREWVKTVEDFMEMLKDINFSGGDLSDVGIAEGLGEALKMCPFVYGNENHQNVGLQKHCILVAASNPYPLPTPVDLPPECIDVKSDGPLFDAETVAKYFKQCLVSLSVICPRDLPKLQAIYNAARMNPSETDPHVVRVKNPNYLVLISESFMEARDALILPPVPAELLPDIKSPTDWEYLFDSMETPYDFRKWLLARVKSLRIESPSEWQLWQLESNRSYSKSTRRFCDTLSQPEITDLPSTIDLTPSQPEITKPSTVSSSMASASSAPLSTSQEMTSSTKYITSSSLPVAKTVTSTLPPTTSTETQSQPVLPGPLVISASPEWIQDYAPLNFTVPAGSALSFDNVLERDTYRHYHSQLRRLKEKEIYRGSILDWTPVTQLGLWPRTHLYLVRNWTHEEHTFTSLAWERLFQISEPIHQELVLEFASTRQPVRHNVDLWATDGVQFRLGGRDRSISVIDLGVRLGLYTENEVDTPAFRAYIEAATRAQPADFNGPEFWGRISHKEYKSQSSKESDISSRVFRLFHKLLLTTILHRKGTEKVAKNDLYYLHAVVDPDVHLNLPFCVAQLLSCAMVGKMASSKIVGGHLIMKLATSFQIRPEAHSCGFEIVPPKLLTLFVLTTMKILAKNEDGHYYIPEDIGAGEAAIVDPDEEGHQELP